MYPTCLTIAGFDGSGGAGIQADTKTFTVLDCYAMNVITYLAIQNTCGVKKCYSIPLSAIEDQLYAIFEDIRPKVIKIGLLHNIEVIELITQFLNSYANGIPIVLDPVMVAKSGDLLINPKAVEALVSYMFPISSLVTPNLQEVYNILGYSDDFEKVAADMLKFKCKAVLIKGGHQSGIYSNDFFLDSNGNKKWIIGERIDSKHTHGTGCTLSSAIAAFLAHEFTLIDSCILAKNFVSNSIFSAKTLKIGKGSGPLDHFHHLRGKVCYLSGNNNEIV